MGRMTKVRKKKKTRKKASTSKVSHLSLSHTHSPPSLSFLSFTHKTCVYVVQLSPSNLQDVLVCSSPPETDSETKEMVGESDDEGSIYSVEVGHEDRPIYVAPDYKNEDLKELKVAVNALMLKVARLEDKLSQPSALQSVSLEGKVARKPSHSASSQKKVSPKK